VGAVCVMFALQGKDLDSSESILVMLSSTLTSMNGGALYVLLGSPACSHVNDC
jgi:hypothetical protein